MLTLQLNVIGTSPMLVQACNLNRNIFLAERLERGQIFIIDNLFVVRRVGFAHQQQDRVMEGTARPTGFFNNLRFQEINAI